MPEKGKPKPNTVLYRLAQDLLTIFKDTLTAEAFDPADPADREGLHLRILAQLSQPYYASKLLFRDFGKSHQETFHFLKDLSGKPLLGPDGKPVRIADQAITYLYEVLQRRLGLAKVNVSTGKPTNMHELLTHLCRRGSSGWHWRQAEIQRSLAGKESRVENLAFARTKKALKNQINRLGKNYSAESRSARKQHGPYWLCASDCVAEVPEELSLFHDVLEAVPKPLQAGFADDWDIRLYLLKVLESLNERYKLLRSCGFDPTDWLDRDSPSIPMLKEMTQLKTKARRFLQSHPMSTEAAAYEKAFEVLRNGRPHYCGHRSFADFLATEEGFILIGLPARRQYSPEDEDWLTDEPDDFPDGIDEDAVDDLDPLAALIDSMSDKLKLKEQLKQLLITQPAIDQDPLRRFFFLEVIPERIGDRSLLENAKFLKLIAAHPEFAGLSAEQSYSELIREFLKLAQRAIDELYKRGKA
ncbi:MAG: hypothetical protein U1F76_32290 [Candidatus Competibacteraceae bacterium]